MTKIYIPFTENGFNKIKAEHDELEAKRPQYIVELTRSRDLGDRSENGAYKAARQRVSRTDSRLRFLKKLIENAKIVTPSQTDSVEIGSKVRVNNGKDEIVFEIVGEHEANPLEKKLSYRSPVGQALLRKCVGDEIIVTVPSGLIHYRIIQIDMIE